MDSLRELRELIESRPTKGRRILPDLPSPVKSYLYKRVRVEQLFRLVGDGFEAEFAARYASFVVVHIVG